MPSLISVPTYHNQNNWMLLNSSIMMLERKTDRSNNRDGSSYYTESAQFGRRKMMRRSEKIRGLKLPRDLSPHIETLKFLKININLFSPSQVCSFIARWTDTQSNTPTSQTSKQRSVLSRSLVACNQEFRPYGIPSYWIDVLKGKLIFSYSILACPALIKHPYIIESKCKILH